ncbi:hypothetical protein [Bacteroides sp. 51]|uniref:hypothetical protein n=1 Tax=Bacteroides sp. 51 TaxID=2302938 RepID=UPI0013CF4A13|nr:hypothetical protein [Bacteroides sp. 51]NDV83910.1 hypothetical protein [Bacteroides sp. 51]
MTSNSLIFYGKPQSFERYEITESGYSDKVQYEPRIKIPFVNDEVLHYFFKNGSYYLELYGYANPYQTVRQGVVIGVCVKFHRPIKLSSDNFSLLQSLLKDFKEIALSGQDMSFKALNLIDITEFDQTINKPDVVGILSNFQTSDQLPKPLDNKLTLFYLENFNGIDSLNDRIYNCKDIYFSTNKELFKDILNRAPFEEADECIHALKGVEAEEPPISEKLQGKPMATKPQMNSGAPTGGTSKDKDDLKELNDKLNKLTKQVSQRTKIFIVTSAVYMILFIAFFFGTSTSLDKWISFNKNSKPPTEATAGSQEKADKDGEKEKGAGEEKKDSTESGDGGVVNSTGTSGTHALATAKPATTVNFKPLNQMGKYYTILSQDSIKPKGTTTRISDLVFQIIPNELANLVYMEKNGKLVVNQQERQKLRENTKIVIQAFLNDNLLGEQEYTIAMP